MAVIELNYDLAISQAGKLENTANECKEMVSVVKRQILELKNDWSGEAAVAMLEKLEQWNLETERLSTQLQNQAVQIRKKAAALKAVDDGESANGTAISEKAASSGKMHGGGGRSW